MVTINPGWRYDPFGPFDSCPACLGPVEPRCEGDQVSFRCRTCLVAWRTSLGHLLWTRINRSEVDRSSLDDPKEAGAGLGS